MRRASPCRFSTRRMACRSPNNMIPASLISPQAMSLLQYYPQPNFTGSTIYNFQVPLIANTHTDNLQPRINKSFKRKNFISGFFGMQDTRSDNDSEFNFLDLTRSLGINATLNYRRTYTPRFYGTFTYQFSRQSNAAAFRSLRIATMFRARRELRATIRSR